MQHEPRFAYIDFEFKPHCRKPELICAVLRFGSSDLKCINPYWLYDEDDKYALFGHLKNMRNAGYILVAFVCDAEAKCLKALGLNPLDFKWLDPHIIGLPFKHSSSEFVTYANKRFKADNTKFYHDRESQLSEEEQYTQFAQEDKKRQAASLLGMYEFFCKKSSNDIEILSKQKESTRQLILSLDDKVTEESKRQILEYCSSDVLVLEELLTAQLKRLGDNPVTLNKYIEFSAFRVRMWDISYQGLPLNPIVYSELLSTYDSKIKEAKLALPQFYEHKPETIGKRGGVYKESWTQKRELLDAWIAKANLLASWPKTKSGHYSTSEETLKSYSIYPDIEQFLRTKKRIKHLEFFNLGSPNCVTNWVTYDADLHPWQHPEYWTFGTSTGRNAHKPPSFIMALERNLRPQLLGCPYGMAIIQADFKAQEVWIAGALSKDPNLLACVERDPYLLFAAAAGLAPPDATKQSHGAARDVCKQVVLGGFYGLWYVNLAKKIGRPLAEAKRLYDRNRQFYKVYFAWSKNMIAYHKMHKYFELADGWPLHDNIDLKGKYAERTTQNFPIQGTAQVIMRKVIQLFYEQNIRCIYTLHDEFGVLCPADEKAITQDKVKKIMQDACKFYFPNIPPCGVDFK